MHITEWKAWLCRKIKPIDKFSRNLYTYIRNHKKQSTVVASLAVLTVTSGAYAQYYYQSNVYPIYHVMVNGKEIGVVNSPEVISKWTEAKLKEESAKHDGLSLKLSDFITYVEEIKYKGEYDNEAALAALSRVADIKVEAAKVIVDGKTVGYAASEQEAREVLARLQQKFGGIKPNPKESSVRAASVGGESGIKEVRFKEEIEIVRDSVTAAQVLTPDKLEQLLSQGTMKQVIHTVQEGDCITCIAKKYGITSKDIYANNPGVTENTILQLGQQINVTARKPFVTVQVVEEVEQEETIDYTVQTRNNEKLPKGETKVIQEGKEGKKRVRYQIVKENGQITERKVLNQEVLVQPVAKIVERGTKVIPSRGTGRLKWPARGSISSGFGQRWGRMHQGIDIAGSGSIRAADNGRVVSAGWNGGYGNAVIIDHGNGLQTLYGHMKSVSVKRGDVVAQGQVIGVMGSTGHSTGVHLHFEVRKNGRPQNPLGYLSR